MSQIPTVPLIEPRPWCRPGEATFYWQPPENFGINPITAYTIACDAISFSSNLGADQRTYTKTGLTDGVDYTFTLTATNTDGTSDAATFRTVMPGTSPYGPTEATLSTINGRTGLITWDLSTTTTEGDVKWFRIRSVPSTIGVPSEDYTAYANERQVIAANLPNSNYYRFSVEAVNDTGYSQHVGLTSNLFFYTARPGGLRVHIDAADSNSYPGSGSTWSNLVTSNATNYYILGNSPTLSNVVYNGTSNNTMMFNGTNQYIRMANTLSPLIYTEGLSNETREFWLYWRGSNGVIMSEEGQAGVPGSGWTDTQISISSSKLIMGFWSGTYTQYEVYSGLASNQWVHITYAYSNDTNTLAAYVNGAQTYSNNSGPQRVFPTTAYYLNFGYPSAGNRIGNSYYYGGLGEYSWYNCYLNAAEISSNYNAQKGRYGV